MLVLVYRKCSTCQKALKWLEEHKIFFEERAIVDENPTYEELKEWYGKSGLHAGQTPLRNWRRLRPDRFPREGVGGEDTGVKD